MVGRDGSGHPDGGNGRWQMKCGGDREEFGVMLTGHASRYQNNSPMRGWASSTGRNECLEQSVEVIFCSARLISFVVLGRRVEMLSAQSCTILTLTCLAPAAGDRMKRVPAERLVELRACLVGRDPDLFAGWIFY